MLRRALVPALVAALSVTSAAFTHPPVRKSPPWISIESPVNPFDSHTRGALFLVHAMTAHGTPNLSDVSATAEGIVSGARRSVTLTLEAADRPGVFIVRRQWPADGSWIVRVSLFTATAIVSFDRTGSVASARVPTELSSGYQVPRPVLAREIDSALADAAKR